MHRLEERPDQGWDPATQPKRPDQSLGELFSQMTSDLGTLVRQELALAKLEAKEQGMRVGRGAGMLGAAGMAAWLGIVFLSFALAWLIDRGLDRALSFAIVGVAWALVALVLMVRGRRQLREAKPLPTTTETIKEDVRWVRALKS
jgi:uncharacterized membrane protein YqjE